MDRLQRMLGAGGMGGAGAGVGDAPQQDTSEQIYISSLALLKMLKHGRAGVPLEVMGLMLGEFVDEYTVKVRACTGWSVCCSTCRHGPAAEKKCGRAGSCRRCRRGSSSRADWSCGSAANAGRRRCRLPVLPAGGGRVCDAAVGYRRERGGGGPRLPNQDARHAQTSWQVRTGEGWVTTACAAAGRALAAPTPVRGVGQ